MRFASSTCGTYLLGSGDIGGLELDEYLARLCCATKPGGYVSGSCLWYEDPSYEWGADVRSVLKLGSDCCLVCNPDGNSSIVSCFFTNLPVVGPVCGDSGRFGKLEDRSEPGPLSENDLALKLVLFREINICSLLGLDPTSCGGVIPGECLRKAF